MKLIKRCWGCGKRILPWQKIIHTKRISAIHKGCVFMAEINYTNAKMFREFQEGCEESALKRLNQEEIK